VVVFDVFEGCSEAFFLVLGKVGEVAFGVGLEEVDESGLHEKKLNDARATAFAAAFGGPTHFAESAQTGNGIAGVGVGGEKLLEGRIFGVRPQFEALCCKYRRLDEGEHGALLCDGFWVFARAGKWVARGEEKS
jgi:hypothetical protein